MYCKLRLTKISKRLPQPECMECGRVLTSWIDISNIWADDSHLLRCSKCKVVATIEDYWGWV